MAEEVKKGYLSLLLRAIIFILIIVILFTQILFLTRVSGNDMFPSLKDGDLALGYRLQKEYHTNDVILYEQNGKRHYGRVIALGGSGIDITEDGQVKVNGLSESGAIIYPTYKKGKLKYPYHVPKNTLFVLSDHRSVTNDSRQYGAIPLSHVKGKVLTIMRRRGL